MSPLQTMSHCGMKLHLKGSLAQVEPGRDLVSFPKILTTEHQVDAEVGGAERGGCEAEYAGHFPATIERTTGLCRA